MKADKVSGRCESNGFGDLITVAKITFL